MKILVWINRIITAILAVVLLLFAITVIISKANGQGDDIFGYELKTVLSGSMEPTFMTGSIIAIQPGGDLTRFQPGDVITFKIKEQMIVTHRVVEVIKDGENVLYRTKGDHNKTADLELVLSQHVIGQYTGFTVPYAGYLFSYTSTNLGSALLLIIPGLLLIGNSVYSLWREFSELEKNNKYGSLNR
ncbi:signal peptidase I SipW [Schinkia sp. CFF1]